MFQHVTPRSSSATRAWPSRWRFTPRLTTKPSSMPLPGYITSSTRPEWLPVATELATDAPKMILETGVLPGQSGAPGRIRTRDPLLRRQLLCPAELRALERNCVRRRSRDGHAEVAVCVGP